jgi:predicted RNA-binding protein YlxR (DUF448 family)
MNTANINMIRINVTVPGTLWTELEQEIPSRGKSAFITKAIEEKLQNAKRTKAFEKLASLPPTFVTIADGSRYIRNMRQEEDKKRSKKLPI